MTKKTQTSILFMLAFSLFMPFFASCKSEKGSGDVPVAEEDLDAKKKMQGTWVNDIDGSVLFTVKGDTIYYNDSISAPVSFHVLHDTLFMEYHDVVKYPIRRLNTSALCFVNADGDEVELSKSSDEMNTGEYRGQVSLNQGKVVKRDTVVVSGSTRYHAYTQVNPTSYKVYRNMTNSNGLTTETVYFDNIVYIGLYDGQRKVYGKNIEKKDFAKLVPESYLSQAILSEVVVDSATPDGVRFVAVLSIPESYTNYRVNIDIDSSGNKKMSL